MIACKVSECPYNENYFCMSKFILLNKNATCSQIFWENGVQKNNALAPINGEYDKRISLKEVSFKEIKKEKIEKNYTQLTFDDYFKNKEVI